MLRRLAQTARLVVALLGLWGICAVPAAAGSVEPATALTVHFFDVGQGDAALVVSPTGKTVLIDGGPPEARLRLARELQRLVHRPLDLVILTHPHLDHLGGLTRAIEAVGAKRFMDVELNHPSKALTHLLQYVFARQITYVHPDIDGPGTNGLVTVGLGGGAALAILWPRQPVEPLLHGTRSDVNANSIVARLTFGKTAFLFPGDAEAATENALLRENVDLTSTVLKVGHHGSRYSSTRHWLNAVRPKVAVVSCGAGNQFGHPASETLELLGELQVQVFRTDQDGEVIAVSDGNFVTIGGQRQNGEPLRVRGEGDGGGIRN